MGMINAAPAPQMSPLLTKAMQHVEATVKPQDKDAYQRIVAAGLKMAFDPSTHSAITEGLDKSQDPVHDVAVGVVGLILLMDKQSKGTMPAPMMIPAGQTLVFHGLDYLEQTKGITIGNNEIDTATKIFIQTIMPKLGLTPQRMQQLGQQTHGAMQNQPFMRKFKQHTQGM